MPNHEEIPTTDTAQIEQIIERLNQLRILLLELALFESLDELLDLRGVGGWNFFVIWHGRSNALILCQVRAVAKPLPHFFFFSTLYRTDTKKYARWRHKPDRKRLGKGGRGDERFLRQCLSSTLSIMRSALRADLIMDKVELMSLVCERVDDVVDPKLVGLVGGVNGIEWIARPLPVIAHVIVVVHDHHQPASTVFQPIKLRRPPAIRRLYIESFD